MYRVENTSCERREGIEVKPLCEEFKTSAVGGGRRRRGRRQSMAPMTPAADRLVREELGLVDVRLGRPDASGTATHVAAKVAVAGRSRTTCEISTNDADPWPARYFAGPTGQICQSVLQTGAVTAVWVSNGPVDADQAATRAQLLRFALAAEPASAATDSDTQPWLSRGAADRAAAAVETRIEVLPKQKAHRCVSVARPFHRVPDKK